MLFFIKLFLLVWVSLLGSQILLLTLCSRVTPGSAGGSYVVPRTEYVLATCSIGLYLWYLFKLLSFLFLDHTYIRFTPVSAQGWLPMGLWRAYGMLETETDWPCAKHPTILCFQFMIYFKSKYFFWCFIWY